MAIGQYLIKKALVEEGEMELKAALKQDPTLSATIEPAAGEKGEAKEAKVAARPERPQPEAASAKKEPAKESAKEKTGSPGDGEISVEVDSEDILARMRHVKCRRVRQRR